MILRSSYIGLIVFLFIFGSGENASGILPGNDYKVETLLNRDTIGNLSLQKSRFIVPMVQPSRGIQLYKDGIIFLSNTKMEKRMPPGFVSFGKGSCFLGIPGDSSLAAVTKCSISGTGLFLPEGMSFCNNPGLALVTQINESSGKPAIYKASLSTTDTGNLNIIPESVPISFTNDSFIMAYPAMSFDGKMVIFSADGPSSAGGMDLYLSRYGTEGWSKPVNLGPIINTRGDETFPFLDTENNLFFSSNGLPGKGGFDVFVCRYINSGWEKPVNLGTLINTAQNELFFRLRKNRKQAFFSCITATSQDVLDIYSVKLQPGSSSTDLFSEIYQQAIAEISLKGNTLPIAWEFPEFRQKIVPTEAKASKDSSLKSKSISIKSSEKKTESKPLEKQESKTVIPSSVIYRIQITSYPASKGSYTVTVGGKNYKTFEYLYKGAYRAAIGEFASLKEAKAFMVKCRQSGITDGFIVAFKDNVRSNDPELFK